MPDTTGYYETQDDYIPELTLNPSDLAIAIVMEVYNAAITYVIAQANTSNKAQFKLGNEIQLGPGIVIMKGAQGVKVKSATIGTPAIVNATVYYVGEPLPNIQPNAGNMAIVGGQLVVLPMSTSGGAPPTKNVEIQPTIGSLAQDGTADTISVDNLDNVTLRANPPGSTHGQTALFLRQNQYAELAATDAVGNTYYIRITTTPDAKGAFLTINCVNSPLGIEGIFTNPVGKVFHYYLEIETPNGIEYIPIYH
jgi:hypothetical protein